MPAKHLKNSRAFTLIETLVAIAILMISVSGPLAIADKALTASLYAKDQSTASFLAQEEMEIVKNVKDNNIVNNGNSYWISQGLASCIGGNYCDMTIPGGSLTKVGCPSSGCKLYVDASDGYTDNNSIGNPTIFSRSLNLSGSGCIADGSGSECQVTVIVSWNEGTISNAVTLSSEILNVAP